MARSEIRMVWRWDKTEYSLGGERGWVCVGGARYGCDVLGALG